MKRADLIRGLSFSLVTAIVLAGCGGGGGTTYSKSAIATANVSSSSSSSVATVATPPVLEDSVENTVVFKPQSLDNDSKANEYQVLNYNLRSIHYNKVESRSIRALEIYRGSLKVENINTKKVNHFDWLASIDENGQVVSSNKTLLLDEGEYELSLLLENGAKQYVSHEIIEVQNKNQLKIDFKLHAVIGDLITNIDLVNALPEFELKFPNNEISYFADPKIGVIINNGEESIFTISKNDGKPEGMANLVNNDKVKMNFYDGSIQKGSSNEITVKQGESSDIVFVPLYGEVDIASSDKNNTLNMSFIVPNELVSAVNGIANLRSLLTYTNGTKYNEKVLTFAENNSSKYEAFVELNDVDFSTIGYSLIFTDTSINEEIGRCNHEPFNLTNSDVTKTCDIELNRGVVITPLLKGVAGFNVEDNSGFAKEGVAIYANDIFLGYTGAGSFGAKGYLKALLQAGDYTIKAIDTNDSQFFKDISIDPLSVNNYILPLKDGNASALITLAQTNFVLNKDEQTSTTISITNTGDTTLFYDIKLIDEDGSVLTNTIKREVFSNSFIVFGTTANNQTGLITFDYTNSTGSILHTTKLNYSETGNKVIVKYKDSKARGLKNRFEVKILPTTNAVDYVTKLNELNGDAEIEYAEPDYRVQMAAPVDTYYSLQWGHHNSGGSGKVADADIDFPEYYDSLDSQNRVIVAVIDSGVEYTHDDLKDNMWVNIKEIPNNNIDDDGNGYIDDVYGYDFHANDSDPMDENGHGTHVAGIIGASANTIGVVGVNPKNIKIMALRFIGSDGYGYTSDAIAAIEYAINNGANITNNSWGGYGYSQALKETIENAKNANQLFVAAAGNDSLNIDNNPHYPSSYDIANVISVGASNASDGLAYFSNYGTRDVDMLAPGEQIVSTYIGNSYAYASGTSMASPYVAGVASLVLSKNINTPFEVIKDIVINSGDTTTAAQNYTNSKKRLNGNNAYTAFDPSQKWIVIEEQTTGELAQRQTVMFNVLIDATNLQNTSKTATVQVDTNGEDKSFQINLNVN